MFPSPAVAPCRLACPINQNVQEYIACIAESRFPDAAAVIRRTNPFPSICGRLCPHPCELECSRGAIDHRGPVAIRELKRFTADLEIDAIENDFPVFPQTRDQKIAVIGAGPAGLTAAFDLRKLGFHVTVFESMPFAGGLLALSCTPQVLPPKILNKDIEAIRTAGVDIITNTTLGKDPSIQDLGRLGFAAILIATGAGRVLLRGELEEAKELSGFLEPSDWLRRRKQDKQEKLSLKGRKVVINGVTSWSVHWAMLAVADGAKSVTLLTHLPAAHLPVEKEFLKMAKAAGVRLTALHGPARIVSKRGAISGVELQKYKVDGSDTRGRVKLKKAAGRSNNIAAHIFIPTGPSVFDATVLGKGSDRESCIGKRTIHGPTPVLTGDENIETTLRGSLIVDPETMLVSPDGIFAAGDAVTGTRSIIETIASGRRAAANIHCFLSGEKMLPIAIDPGAAAELGDKTVALKFRDISPRRPLRAPAIDRSAASSADRGKKKRAVSTKEEAMAEARKCLRCGACVECDTCHHFCGWTLHTGPFGANGPGDVFRIDAALGDSTPDGSAGGLMNVQALRAHVNEHLCDGCGLCEPACPYKVINTSARRRSETGDAGALPEMALIDPEMCRACGLCAAACPPRAITFEGLCPEDVVESIQKIAPAPVTLKCAWSSGRRQESEIHVGCLGQVPPAVYLKAIEAGCSGVLALGCGPDACHHKTGFDQARRIIDDIKMVLAMAGINPRRIEIAGHGIDERAAALEKLRSLKPLNDRGREKTPELRRFMMEPSPSIEIRSAALVQARYAKPDTGAGAATEGEGKGVLHFPGCLAAALQLSGGAQPGRSRSFRCCGLEFLRAGENAKFSEIAASNIEHFSALGAHTVVVSCTDCLHCFRKHYGAVEKPANLKFVHLVEFLTEGGGLTAAGGPVEPQLPRKVAFLPSHRNSAEDGLIVDFLGKLPGIELVAHGRGAATAVCCGENGWKTSGRDAKRAQLATVAAACESGAEVIVTASSSCFYHLQKIHRAGSWQLHDIEIEPFEVFIKGLSEKTV